MSYTEWFFVAMFIGLIEYSIPILAGFVLVVFFFMVFKAAKYYRQNNKED